jgi:hypothetical protein
MTVVHAEGARRTPAGKITGMCIAALRESC